MTLAHAQSTSTTVFTFRALAAEVHRRDPALTVTGWVQIAALAAVLVLAPFDTREILGLNPWVKPSKFLISLAIYTWTVAWFLAYLPAVPRTARFIGAGVSFVMMLEIICVMLQSFRGVRSHFNDTTAFDSAVFGVMGVGIAINTALLALLLILLFARVDPTLPRPYLWAVRFGVALIVAGSAEGGMMIAHGAHAVGVADGGAGLPYVNWSTEGGDLRAAHAVGLHGLQVLPLGAFLLSRSKPQWTESRQLWIVMGGAALYSAFGVALFSQALAGRPLVAW